MGWKARTGLWVVKGLGKIILIPYYIPRFFYRRHQVKWGGVTRAQRRDMKKMGINPSMLLKGKNVSEGLANMGFSVDALEKGNIPGLKGAVQADGDIAQAMSMLGKEGNQDLAESALIMSLIKGMEGGTWGQRRRQKKILNKAIADVKRLRSLRTEEARAELYKSLVEILSKFEEELEAFLYTGELKKKLKDAQEATRIPEALRKIGIVHQRMYRKERRHLKKLKRHTTQCIGKLTARINAKVREKGKNYLKLKAAKAGLLGDDKGVTNKLESERHDIENEINRARDALRDIRQFQSTHNHKVDELIAYIKASSQLRKYLRTALMATWERMKTFDKKMKAASKEVEQSTKAYKRFKQYLARLRNRKIEIGQFGSFASINLTLMFNHLIKARRIDVEGYKHLHPGVEENINTAINLSTRLTLRTKQTEEALAQIAASHAKLDTLIGTLVDWIDEDTDQASLAGRNTIEQELKLDDFTRKEAGVLEKETDYANVWLKEDRRVLTMVKAKVEASIAEEVEDVQVLKVARDSIIAVIDYVVAQARVHAVSGAAKVQQAAREADVGTEEIRLRA